MIQCNLIKDYLKESYFKLDLNYVNTKNSILYN